jgi:hypothetical protein
VSVQIFSADQMNQAGFTFRRYEEAPLRNTSIESHAALSHYGRGFQTKPLRGVWHKLLIFNILKHVFESSKRKNWPRILMGASVFRSRTNF